MTLLPCCACARHVRDDAVTCPFCAAAFTAGSPARYPPSVRVTAVAAVSAAIALGGCTPPADQSSYGVASTEDCCTPSDDAAGGVADVTVAESGSASDAGLQNGESSSEGQDVSVTETSAGGDASQEAAATADASAETSADGGLDGGAD